MRKPSLTSVPMSMISLYVMSLMAMVSLSPDEIAMASTAKVLVRRLTYEKRVHAPVYAHPIDAQLAR